MRRAGLLPGIVLLKTSISRIRNLSTEDGFPAWRIAAVGRSYFLSYIFSFFTPVLSKASLNPLANFSTGPTPQ
jgi:hypothetical protein